MLVDVLVDLGGVHARGVCLLANVLGVGVLSLLGVLGGVTVADVLASFAVNLRGDVLVVSVLLLLVAVGIEVREGCQGQRL